MKLLTAGYGAGNGPNMVLMRLGDHVDARLEEILLSYSCHPPALPKIRACLEASARYDAWIQPGWVFDQHRAVRRDLLEIYIGFHITSVPEFHRPRAIRSGLRWGELPT